MKWHYSKSMPSSKLVKYGVWEDGEFIGAVIFGRGASKHLLHRYDLEATEGCELVRVALKEHRTPVTRIVAIALRLLKNCSPGLRLVVSFADKGQGHLGRIYQAGNWIYTGETNKNKFPFVDGRVRHPRCVPNILRAGRHKDRSDITFVETPLKHRYLYPLDNEIRQLIEKLAKPYPKCPTGEKVSYAASSSE